MSRPPSRFGEPAPFPARYRMRQPGLSHGANNPSAAASATPRLAAAASGTPASSAAASGTPRLGIAASGSPSSSSVANRTAASSVATNSQRTAVVRQPVWPVSASRSTNVEPQETQGSSMTVFHRGPSLGARMRRSAVPRGQEERALERRAERASEHDLEHSAERGAGGLRRGSWGAQRGARAPSTAEEEPNQRIFRLATRVLIGLVR